MLDILYLKDQETIIGVLKVYDVDQPWFHCNFEPSPAFEAFKPIFDQELQLLHQITTDESLKAWEDNYQRISELKLVDATTGKEINEFLIHIDGNHAWFRY